MVATGPISNRSRYREALCDDFESKDVLMPPIFALCGNGFAPMALATVGGFEPPDAGVKVLCLAAWRHRFVPGTPGDRVRVSVSISISVRIRGRNGFEICSMQVISDALWFDILSGVVLLERGLFCVEFYYCSDLCALRAGYPANMDGSDPKHLGYYLLVAFPWHRQFLTACYTNDSSLEDMQAWTLQVLLNF